MNERMLKNVAHEDDKNHVVEVQVCAYSFCFE
jgi:hypothetical protein